MALVRPKHLALALAVPLSILAALESYAQDPEPLELAGPEDHHERPQPYNEPTLADELLPVPSAEPAQYPLAVTFNPADPSNYTAGGMISHDYVVVHTMQGYYYGAQSWFQNPSANVSAHFCMQSEDGEVTQMVMLEDRAWHVGSSNPYAIGIEHEGFIDEPAWYTWETYSASARLARWVADQYEMPLDRDHIVGHVELPNQTHTDPGIHWDWDLYMALITDIVAEARIEGWVVNHDAACTITATSDTWVKKTLEPADDLGDTDKCSIPAGTELSYLHASGDLIGHRRLDYEAAGSPCEGFLDLDTQGFIFAGHWSATCPQADMAAAGVAVILDGGLETTTDANGYFVFDNVGPGAHTLDVVGGEAYTDTYAPVDLDVYPGARTVISVDPLAGPGDGDGDTGDTGDTGDGADTDGECPVGAEGCACTVGGGCDPGLTCEDQICVPDGDEGGQTGDDGLGEDGTGGGMTLDYLEGDSCACTSERSSPAPWGLALLGLLGLGLRRRG